MTLSDDAIREAQLIETQLRDAEVSDEFRDSVMESLTNAITYAVRLENDWWRSLGGNFFEQSKNFIQLAQIQELAVKCYEHSFTNPLIAKGKELRSSYITSYGFNFRFPELAKTKDGTKLLPKNQSILDNPQNKRVLFSTEAIRELNDNAYYWGNDYIVWDSKARTFSRVPLSQITGFITADDDPSLVMYFRRSFTKHDTISGKSPEKIEYWIPTDYFKAHATYNKNQKSIKVSGKEQEIRHDLVVFDWSPNRTSGQVFGLPDNFAAIPWAVGYSTYLKDGQRLLAALASIAFQVKAKTESNAKKLREKIAGARAGSALVTPESVELASVPRGNAVDLQTGLPFAAQAATALSIARNNLTSFATEGGYGSATSITETEKLWAEGRQNQIRDFFERIFQFIGLDSGTVDFNRLRVDPIYRQMASLSLAYAYGFINQSEGRERSVELLDIPHANLKELPEPNEFTGSKASTLQHNLDLTKSGDGDSGYTPDDSPLPRQGNSGTGGSITPDNASRDEQ